MYERLHDKRISFELAGSDSEDEFKNLFQSLDAYLSLAQYEGYMSLYDI